jgi:hypothetical protein
MDISRFFITVRVLRRCCRSLFSWSVRWLFPAADLEVPRRSRHPIVVRAIPWRQSRVISETVANFLRGADQRR